ncbi:hypothetical protein HFN89_01580 [Rhizobium laguerreae]|nr:hypothetical protein [Rhizobium laguerreae]
MTVRTHVEIEAELKRLGERLAGTYDGEEHRKLVADIEASRDLLGRVLLARDKKMRPEVYGLPISHDAAEDRAVSKAVPIAVFGKRVVAAVKRLVDDPITIEALEAEMDVLARRLARANDAEEHDRIVGELDEVRKHLGGLLLARDKRSRPSVYAR